ncbi:MAG: CsgG/HfaB family protein [Acidobacteriota bacterium]
MFSTKAFRLTMIFLLALACAVPSARAQRKKQIAVLNFDFATVDIGLARNVYGNHENLARAISDKLVNTLVAQNSCVVVERSLLEKVLHEQNLGTQGRIDPNTAAKVGKAAGADAIIIGNVAMFELLGEPKSTRDDSWDPSQLGARITVNFRVVDTTTGVVEASNGVTGTSGQSGKSSAGQQVTTRASDALGDLVGRKVRIAGVPIMGNRDKTTRASNEQVRNVVQVAVDDVVGQMTVDIEKYLTGTRRQPEAVAAEKQIHGRVIDVQGPTIFIADINRSAVRVGDRLYVRRERVKTMSGKSYTFTDQIGEVEIVEIQSQVVVGSFSGSGKAQDGDIITNNPGGAAPASSGRNAPSQPVPQPAPSAGAPEPKPQPARPPVKKRP